MAAINESEELIRRIYQITNDYQKGFDIQISQLLILGLERFNLDIGILSKIEGSTYTILNCVTPEEFDINQGDIFDCSLTYCEITCSAFAPVAISYMKQDEKFSSHPAYSSLGLESYIGIPIFVDDEVVGTLNFSSVDPRDKPFEQTDIDAIKLMASWIEVEMIRRKQEQQLQVLNRKLEAQALIDPLTQISNRRCMFRTLNSDLDKIKRAGGTGTFALVDIDHFKIVNDTYGHQVGDEVLKNVADKLKQVVGSTDYLARFGGEEFLVWLPEKPLAQRVDILNQLHQSVQEVKAGDDPITVSIGACHFVLGDIDQECDRTFLDELILMADECLYQAKNQGRNQVNTRDFIPPTSESLI